MFLGVDAGNSAACSARQRGGIFFSMLKASDSLLNILAIGEDIELPAVRANDALIGVRSSRIIYGYIEKSLMCRLQKMNS